MSITNTFYMHRVGDGVHYINDRYQEFDDGTEQYGDTSEPCILRTLQNVLFENGTGANLCDVWNAVYPEDPMTTDDLDFILVCAEPFVTPFDATDPENIAAVIYDLTSMGCKELAEYMSRLVWPA